MEEWYWSRFCLVCACHSNLCFPVTQRSRFSSSLLSDASLPFLCLLIQIYITKPQSFFLSLCCALAYFFKSTRMFLSVSWLIHTQAEDVGWLWYLNTFQRKMHLCIHLTFWPKNFIFECFISLKSHVITKNCMIAPAKRVTTVHIRQKVLTASLHNNRAAFLDLTDTTRGQ